MWGFAVLWNFSYIAALRTTKLNPNAQLLSTAAYPQHSSSHRPTFFVSQRCTWLYHTDERTLPGKLQGSNPSVSSCNNNNKYQELANEICALWKQNAAPLIPVVISSTGVIPKSPSQSLKRLNLHPNTYIKMQKSVILGTCSVVRNFLNYK